MTSENTLSSWIDSRTRSRMEDLLADEVAGNNEELTTEEWWARHQRTSESTFAAEDASTPAYREPRPAPAQQEQASDSTPSQPDGIAVPRTVVGERTDRNALNDIRARLSKFQPKRSTNQAAPVQEPSGLPSAPPTVQTAGGTPSEEVPMHRPVGLSGISIPKPSPRTPTHVAQRPVAAPEQAEKPISSFVSSSFTAPEPAELGREETPDSGTVAETPAEAVPEPAAKASENHAPGTASEAPKAEEKPEAAATPRPAPAPSRTSQAFTRFVDWTNEYTGWEHSCILDEFGDNVCGYPFDDAFNTAAATLATAFLKATEDGDYAPTDIDPFPHRAAHTEWDQSQMVVVPVRTRGGLLIIAGVAKKALERKQAIMLAETLVRVAGEPIGR